MHLPAKRAPWGEEARREGGVCLSSDFQARALQHCSPARRLLSRRRRRWPLACAAPPRAAAQRFRLVQQLAQSNEACRRLVLPRKYPIDSLNPLQWA